MLPLGAREQFLTVITRGPEGFNPPDIGSGAVRAAGAGSGGDETRVLSQISRTFVRGMPARLFALACTLMQLDAPATLCRHPRAMPEIIKKSRVYSASFAGPGRCIRRPRRSRHPRRLLRRRRSRPRLRQAVRRLPGTKVNRLTRSRPARIWSGGGGRLASETLHRQARRHLVQHRTRPRTGLSGTGGVEPARGCKRDQGGPATAAATSAGWKPESSGGRRGYRATAPPAAPDEPQALEPPPALEGATRKASRLPYSEDALAQLKRGSKVRSRA